MGIDDATQPTSTEEHIRQGREFIAEVHAKMNRLVEEFAQGKLNRAQFHRLYERYQRRIMLVAQMIIEDDPTKWRSALEKDEETIYIRRRLTAKVLGMALYDNASGMPIESLGNFQVDSDLLVPMLSSFQSATKEIFRAGMRSSAMENGQWLSFVPGAYSTLLSLFSREPSNEQLDAVERMHRDFERANRAALEAGNADPSELAYPFLAFVRRSRR